MRRCSVPRIPVLWLSLVLLAASSLTAQTLESLAESYRKAPGPRTRAALAQFAQAHSKEESGALARLALAAGALDGRDWSTALHDLDGLEKRLSKLSDYVLALRAGAMYESKDLDGAVKQAEAVLKSPAKSPLAPRAVVIAARALIDKGRSVEAIRLLQDRYSDLNDSRADSLLASAAEASGDVAAAAGFYQRLYYLNPTSKEAADAEAALARLRSSLGDRYPEAKADVQLARALRLAKAGQRDKARDELEGLVQRLSGADRDTARVRIGVVDYQDKEINSAYRYLKNLQVSAGEADAERLYYLHLAARKLDYDDEALTLADEESRRYPQSRWRMQMLMSAADLLWRNNEPERSQAMYRACYESFPSEPEAWECHWKVVWAEYLKRSPGSAGLLREHIVRFPASDKASASLYFLGRLAEKSKDYGSARAFYQELPLHYPHSYYSVLAREKLAQGTISVADAQSASARRFLDSLNLPKIQKPVFDVNAITRLRLDRARMLDRAGLDDWSETELRFAARNDAQPHLVAMELARSAQRRGATDQGIRFIKAYAPGYLSIPFESAPAEFWRLAFPMPYRLDLERNAKSRGVDPFLVAALIRQESEFNPKAVSRANAYGLTQVLPSTGRSLSRKVGLKRFNSKMLFTPAVNLNLGTYYLRNLYDSLGEKWEPTLASYNAGKSRVDRWLTWNNYQEPSEFIETIPFRETRDYVMIILRNADVYRRLYAGTAAQLTSEDGEPPAVQRAAATTNKSSAKSLKKTAGSTKKRKSSRRSGG